MKKILGVIVMSLLFSTLLNVHAKRDNRDFYKENVIFIVKRHVFYGDFQMSSLSDKVLYTENSRYISDITFTKVFARSKLTGKTELLFEMRRNIRDYYYISGKLYLLTDEGVFSCGINGENARFIIDGSIRSLAVSDSCIYYCRYNRDTNCFQIEKCALDGSNDVVVANNVSADKLTIVGSDLIFSDLVKVGKIVNDNHVDSYITNLVVPMPGGDTGSHFVVNDRLIISGYMEPDDRKYGEYPTIIMDLDGNVLNVWRNTFLRNINESNGRVYASIDNMDENGQVLTIEDEEGTSSSTGGIYYISNDFKEKHLELQSRGFSQMYINGDNVFFHQFALFWLKGDVLRNGAIENVVSESVEADSIDNIEVLVMDNTPINKASDNGIQYRGKLLVFDDPPIVKNGHVMVPIRKIFESIGAVVLWDELSRTVTVKKSDVELRFQIGSSILYKNNKEIILSISTEINNNRSFVPLQVFIEGLNSRVVYDEEKKAIWIWTSME